MSEVKRMKERSKRKDAIIANLKQENQALRDALDQIVSELDRPGHGCEAAVAMSIASEALAPHAKKQDGGE